MTRKRSTLGFRTCCATQSLAIGFRKCATNMGREKSLAKTLGSDVIVAKLKNERACFVPRMQIHLFTHGVGNRRISSHEGVSNPFRGSVRIQLPMRIVSVLNGLQPRVEVEWWRVGEEVGERRGGGKLPILFV